MQFLLFFAATAAFVAVAVAVAATAAFAFVALVATAISVIVVVIGLVVGAGLFLSTMWFFLSSARITDIRAVSCLANGPECCPFRTRRFFHADRFDRDGCEVAGFSSGFECVSVFEMCFR